jgi:hypothetical protein
VKGHHPRVVDEDEAVETDVQFFGERFQILGFGTPIDSRRGEMFAAQREVERMKTSADRGVTAARSCEAQVTAMPEYQSIKVYMVTDGPSLAAQTNSSKGSCWAGWPSPSSCH